MSQISDWMMKSRGTGKEEVGEQKLINKDAILTAFGGGNRTNKKHGKSSNLIEEGIFYIDEKRG